MRTWLLKFRISAALDAGKKLPPGLMRRIHRSPEADRFAETAQALETALKDNPADRRPPSGLHQAIMRSVRAAQRPMAPQATLVWDRWLWAAGALACGVLLATVLWRHSPAPHRRQLAPIQAAAIPPSAPDLTDLVARVAPAAVVSPLEQEFRNLGLDLDRTERFILASLP